ncbi:MAG TPA: PA2779 family protein [Candidatus Deferrimicrobiaceae bacterium]|jgi:hypothetical protein
MAFMRRAGWFVMVAVMMAGWMGVLAGARGVAEAAMIPSHGVGETAASSVADLSKMQAFLESKVVVQKLADYGVSPAEAMAKVRQMSESDLHRLASMTEKAAAGGDALGFLISVAILAILVIVILKLLNKEIIVR